MTRALDTLALLSAFALAGHAATPRSCDNIAHADHPSARISNGALSAVLFLPDAGRGYYRGARFDWSGLVACASLNGHSFFGEWFDRYEPTLNDAVTGPAEEFRHPTSELGYDDAAPGGLFLKIGVGMLRRVNASPYSFGGAYPIIDHGTWTVKRTKRSVTFRQELHSAIGFAYSYEKTLSIDPGTNVLTLHHSLRNLGTRPLDTAVYNHDFFMLDDAPVRAGMELRLPFVPVPDQPLPAAALIDGKIIRFTAPLTPGHGVGAYITGYGGQKGDLDFLFEDKHTGVGVEQTSDSALVKMYLWATAKTVCPEGYIGIHVGSGESQSWTLRYRFFTR